jgi:hypothetical protein
MIATNGRWRLGDFKAAIVAAASSVIIGGAALADGAGGGERSHVPKTRQENGDEAQSAPQDDLHAYAPAYCQAVGPLSAIAAAPLDSWRTTEFSRRDQ